MTQIEVKLLDHPLDPAAALRFVESPHAGGIVQFVGSVRNQTKGKRVLRLEFEAYAPMALSEMRKIAEEASRRWALTAIAIYHRVGVLDIGQLPVVIAAAAPHRQAAFEACRYAIDTLKQTVPIWKKEVFEDGEVWVAATP